MRNLARAIAFLGAACSNTTTRSDNSSAGAAPRQGDAKGLAIVELKIYDGNNVLGAYLHGDGRLETLDPHTKHLEPWGTLAADGTFSLPDATSFRVTAEGMVIRLDGTRTESKLFAWSGEALVVGGKYVTIDDKGAMLVNGAVRPDSKTLRFEGATDTRSKHTALFLVGVLFGDEVTDVGEHH